jgi:hypothetical protein
MEKETWQSVFIKQVDSGKFWMNLFKDEFDKHQFLDRSDVIHLCKKAQADIYENIIELFRGRIDDSMILEIENVIRKNWDNDESGIGLTFNK